MENRLGVLAMPVTPSGEILLISNDDENRDKWERVVGVQDNLEEVFGYQFLAGAIESVDRDNEVDWLTLAALREIAEESGMIVSPNQLKMIEERTIVEQKREGKEVSFEVVAYWLLLNEEQTNWLYLGGALSSSETSVIRPRDRGMIELLVPERVEMGVKTDA